MVYQEIKRNMGLNLIKKMTLLFLLISSYFLLSYGRGSKFVNKANVDADAITYKEEGWISDEDGIHERLLRANTRDYGRYDPAPTLAKPPFKVIQN